MKTFGLPQFFLATFAFLIFSSTASAQESTNKAPTPLTAKALVIEVKYFNGRPLAYQATDSWSWYGAFERTSNWKPGTDDIRAVKIVLRPQDGTTVRARVTVLRGKNMDKEDFVTEAVVVPGQKTIVRELLNLDIEPFELQFVRALATVADLPAVVNKTKSLHVSLEPNQSTIPSFVARFLNNSAKPVASFSYFTSAESRRMMSGAPRSQTGPVLIQPGGTYEATFRYATRASAVSTGEMPPVVSGLVLNVTSVVFADGSYEGEAYPAATFLAGKAGEKTQLTVFLDRLRSNGSFASESDVESAISAANADSIAADVVRKFPDLTVQEKQQIVYSVNFGQDVAVKFFRAAIADTSRPLAEVLRARIDSLP